MWVLMGVRCMKNELGIGHYPRLCPWEDGHRGSLQRPVNGGGGATNLASHGSGLSDLLTWSQASRLSGGDGNFPHPRFCSTPPSSTQPYIQAVKWAEIFGESGDKVGEFTLLSPQRWRVTILEGSSFGERQTLFHCPFSS